MDHPFIDFNGDGYGDSYDSAHVQHGPDVYEHEGSHHHVDSIATDYNHDGRIDDMNTDSNHDGTLDTYQHDNNGDGYMDTSDKYYDGPAVHLNHPFIDFDGDGHGDHYTTYATSDGAQVFNHVNHEGHIDAVAVDYNHDGLIDQMAVDTDHDGDLDTVLTDTNGDGYMDTYASI